MGNLLAVLVIGLGVLLVVSGVSGSINAIPNLVGITLPGSESVGPVTTLPGGPPLNSNLGVFGAGGISGGAL